MLSSSQKFRNRVYCNTTTAGTMAAMNITKQDIYSYVGMSYALDCGRSEKTICEDVYFPVENAFSTSKNVSVY